MLRGLPRCEVYRGHARFRTARQVVVGDRDPDRRSHLHQRRRARIRAVDAGTRRSSVPDEQLDDAPRHPAAASRDRRRQLYRVGIRADVPAFRIRGDDHREGPRLIQREDAEVSSAIQDVFASEGINVRLNAKCIQRERPRRRRRRTRRMRGRQSGGRGHASAARGWPAAEHRGSRTRGRRRVTRRAGIHHRERSAGNQRSGNLGARRLQRQRALLRTRPTTTSRSSRPTCSTAPLAGVSDRIPAYGLYIDPPLGRAGLTETEARKGHSVLVGKRPMTRVGRAVEKGETNGLMKIVVDAQSQEILGAAVFGTGGDEVIHCVLDTMYAKAPCSVLRRAMHIHPTVSELIPTLLAELQPPAQ